MNSEQHGAFGLARKWYILLAVGLGTFMTAIDASVANVTLPVLRNYFTSDVTTVEWVVTIYLLVVSGLLLSFGRLGDLRGHKTIYLIGFVIFISGSAICGAATSLPILIGSRALQALGGAMLYANSPAILTGNFPIQQRGQALGLQATMTYLGLMVGPSLGGWLLDQFSWRAVFYINLPVGLLALYLSFRNIPGEETPKTKDTFDIPGAVTFMAGLSALLLGMNQGDVWGWTSPGTLGLLGLAIVILVVFLLIERHTASPMLDLSLFQVRLFSATSTSALLNYICVYSIVFLMPFYLIQGRGFTPGYAGLLLTAQPLIMAIIAPISGTLSDRIGSRVLSTVGMGIMAAGLYLLSRISADTPASQVILNLAIVGFGTGMFISPNTSALMSSAPRNRQGIASGVLATARNVGMVLGVGLAGAIFSTIAGRQVASNASLYQGISASFLVAAGIGVFGMFVSAMRGQKAAVLEKAPRG